MGKKKLLKEFLSKAADKGLTPDQIIDQSIKIDQLEKKYSKSFEDLKNEFDALQRGIENRSRILKEIDESVLLAEKKRVEQARNNAAEDKRVSEYLDAREKLSEIGFPIDELRGVEGFLRSIKAEGYSPEKIIEKLNTLGDLETRRASLESELNSKNTELEEKGAVLAQIRRIQQMGLSTDQFERIRELVSQISARRGINANQAMSRFENDVLKNYDLMLELEDEVARLGETKRSITSEIEERRITLEAKEANLVTKLSELESEHRDAKQEVKAYSDLRALGIESADLLFLHELVSKMNLDFGVLKAALRGRENLKELEEQTSKELEILQDQKKALAASVSSLREQKQLLESSVSSMNEVTMRELEASNLVIRSVVAQVTNETRETLEGARNQLKQALAETTPVIDEFTKDVQGLIKNVGTATKGFDEVTQAGEWIGKYEAFMPLLKLAEDPRVSEKDALVAMSNACSTFVQWLEKQEVSEERLEILHRMKDVLASLNLQILSTGGKEKSSQSRIQYISVS